MEIPVTMRVFNLYAAFEMHNQIVKTVLDDYSQYTLQMLDSGHKDCNLDDMFQRITDSLNTLSKPLDTLFYLYQDRCEGALIESTLHKDLQQAYDRVMAHNAMLWQSASKYLGHNGYDSSDEYIELSNALNTTEADVDAWEKKLRQEVMLAVHPLQPEYEKLQQQLATITAERDALRRAAKRLINANNIKRLEGKTRRYKKCCRNGWLTMRKALAQKTDK